MSEIEICVTCGEELLAWFIDSNQFVMLCPNCDDDEEIEDEDPCRCVQGEINIFCGWCF
jgi:predicted RNA-binding Zn-ribbon protein involved in translation (DUF1610 family)